MREVRRTRRWTRTRRWAQIWAGLGTLLLILPLVVAPPAHAAQEHQGQHQGLQGGWAVDDRGNVNFVSSLALHNPIMHEAEAGWIRVNFRLGACFKDWISPGCNGRTALETYDEVLDIALTNNLRVLALVGHEAWHGSQDEWTARNAEHAGGDGDNLYIRRFAADAVEVLATHFKDKVRHWEIWNEPNAWTERDERGRPRGGSFTFPSNFAWTLTRAYEAIKLSRPDAVIISGGLFGHDLDDPAVLFARGFCPSVVASGADYLCATYEMGLRHVGWQPGEYPFDHVGQHLYIDGGTPTSEEKLRFYLDDVRDAYLAYEGPDTAKTTHITEFGWSTKFVSPEVQARNLMIAFDTFRQVGYIARAYWFHAQDVPEADLFYGLADAAGRKKRAFVVYQDVAAYDSPSDVADEPTTQWTPRVTPGSTAQARPGGRGQADDAEPRERSPGSGPSAGAGQPAGPSEQAGPPEQARAVAVTVVTLEP